MADKIFVNGIVVKQRHDRTPDYVLANISCKVDELIPCLQQHADNGWVNIQIKQSQGGKNYAEVDTWKPTQGGQQAQHQAPTPPPFPSAPQANRYEGSAPNESDDPANDIQM